MKCPICKVDMVLSLDEPMGRSWHCSVCLGQVTEDFSKPEISVDRVPKGENDDT